MEWEIFQYLDGVDATNGNSTKWEIYKKVLQIKKKYGQR
jgi:hypothetical protein